MQLSGPSIKFSKSFAIKRKVFIWPNHLRWRFYYATEKNQWIWLKMRWKYLLPETNLAANDAVHKKKKCLCFILAVWPIYQAIFLLGLLRNGARRALSICQTVDRLFLWLKITSKMFKAKDKHFVPPRYFSCIFQPAYPAKGDGSKGRVQINLPTIKIERSNDARWLMI